MRVLIPEKSCDKNKQIDSRKTKTVDSSADFTVNTGITVRNSARVNKMQGENHEHRYYSYQLQIRGAFFLHKFTSFCLIFYLLKNFSKSRVPADFMRMYYKFFDNTKVSPWQMRA